VRMAHEAGMASALVLTGATPRSAVVDAAYAPDYVLDDVAQILPIDRLREVS
jgi:ribonucleotide monophosphatase NagD (HAD superfamily)